MAAFSRTGWLALLVAGLLPAVALAADRQAKPKPGQYNPDHQTVEMFKAIDAEQIEVKLIPKDSTECNVLIKNKTGKPLNVQLPAAFAGVPVLAQFGGGMGGGGMGGMGGGGMGGMGGGGMSQGMGGGMGGMGGMGGGGMGGMGGGGMGGGMFNIAPEKVGKFKVPTVCLEHGKRDPRPAIPYKIVPIESFTKNAETQEVCRLLGQGRIPQRAAQIAAWHFNNNMSLQELAAKQLRFANGSTRSYFSMNEIKAGMQVIAAAAKLANERQQSPGDSLSKN